MYRLWVTTMMEEDDHIMNNFNVAFAEIAALNSTNRQDAICPSSCDLLQHKVHTYLEYDSVFPLVQIGTPTPSAASDVSPGGTHSPAGEGVGESQFGRLEKKASTLSTLCSTVSLCLDSIHSSLLTSKVVWAKTTSTSCILKVTHCVD